MTEFKVIFTGISNAGKTSILLTLDRQFHKIAKLVPTKGVERSLSTILGFPVRKWDLGGQEKYRETYLKTRPETILESDVIIFVVDIQDPESYPETLEYYKNIISLLNRHEESPHILVCLHKADPEVYDRFKTQIKDLIIQFERLSEEFDPKFFITSIYNRRSIIETFSYGVSLFLPKKKSIDLMLKNYLADVKEMNGKMLGVMLWDENSIFLSMIFEDKKTEEASLTASMGILSIIESFEEKGPFDSLILEVNNAFQFCVRKVGKLYTTLVGKDLNFEKVWEIYETNYLTLLEEIIEKRES